MAARSAFPASGSIVLVLTAVFLAVSHMNGLGLIPIIVIFVDV